MLIGVSTNNKNKKKDNTGSRKFEKHRVKWASLSQGFSVPLKCGYLSPSWQTKRYQLTGKWFKVSTGMKGLSGLVTQKNSQEEKSASLAFKSLKKPPLLKFLLKWLEIHLGFQVFFFFFISFKILPPVLSQALCQPAQQARATSNKPVHSWVFTWDSTEQGHLPTGHTLSYT